MRTDPICVDIEVRWGDQTLLASHLKPPRNFSIGEEGGDAYVPRECLGRASAPVVLQGPASMLRAVVLEHADARIELPQGHVLTAKQATAQGILEACPEVPGARQVWLHPGVRVAMRLPRSHESIGPYRRGGSQIDDALVMVVECSEPEAMPRTSLRRPPWTFWVSASAALALHAAFFLWIAFAMPAMLLTEDVTVDAYQPLFMVGPFITVAESDPDEPLYTDDLAGGPAADMSACGEQGSLGRPDAPSAQNMYGVAGPKDNPDPHIAAHHGDTEAWESFIGLRPEAAYGTRLEPIAPWGRDDSLGNDPVGARGHMTGKVIGDARGNGGVSHGAGGGGFSLGTRRPSACEAPAASAAALHLGVPSVSQPEATSAIRRVAQANAGRWAHCYAGKDLRGRVMIQARIDASGQVESVSDAGSDLGSRDVVQCIVQAFGTLSFPGVATEPIEIVYPMVLAAGT